MAKLLLDLHGCRGEEVQTRVDAFIHQHLKLGTKKVKIMTGKGKGVVLKEVQLYLKLGGFPYSTEKLANGKPNEGVLVIHLND